MTMNEPFSDLPDALVRDLLEAAIPLSEKVSDDFGRLLTLRDDMKHMAQEASLIRRKADLEVTREPSIVGIDGSYQIHSLTSADLCAAAAVAVEGTSKEATRHWEEPYHRFWPGAVPHHQSTTGMLRCLMVSMELELAHIAPHDLVLLDGSFSSLIIYLNQGLSNVLKHRSLLSDELKQRWESHGILQRLIEMLSGNKTIALPKYTSRNELTSSIHIEDAPECDGRTLATLILDSGEYTIPLPIYNSEQYHLPMEMVSEQNVEEMNGSLTGIQVIYFRPYRWVPALRLEVPSSIAYSPTRLALALRGIESQFFVPAIKEPYPLFLADRMVKSLGAGVNVMEQTMAQDVIDRTAADIEDIELSMLFLQNYRTETGRGGT